ncbi:hypothetical protein ABTZ59_29025 [Streptomyces sp. NPDC094034]|uniref:hypothetical protein n=1 Tax=Streptomyces sp. NPDC094034 TaxID=3155309 RepID=UPI00332E7F10
MEMTADGVHCASPGPPVLPRGVRVERSSAASFVLSRDLPGTRPVYYRVDYGRLEWGDDLSSFLQKSARPSLDPGRLLTLVHGMAPAPDATPVPGVHRLAVGTVARVDATGVTVTRRVPELPKTRTGLVQAVGDALGTLGGEYAIAYSGGLSSAFAALSAREAGHRPVLLHADFGSALRRRPTPEIPGFPTRRVSVELSGLLDHHSITGDEMFPPLPDIEVPQRLTARLMDAAGLPVAHGGLLEDLTSIRLPEADAGSRGWRLLGCEPFHITDTLRNLAEARELISRGAVFAPGLGGREIPDKQPVGMASPPKPLGASPMPGLTRAGEEAYSSSQLAMMALWKDHLDFLPPVLGRVIAGLEERGDGGALLPALDPVVLAAVAALPPSKLGRISRGTFTTHLPLHKALRKHRISGASRSTPGQWIRLAAAAHLRRARAELIARMEDDDCPLADMGLVDPNKIMEILRDSHQLTEHALPLLRMVWLDQWLRGRS